MKEGKPKILVVGSMNMDLIMYNVERIPKMGESIYCTGYEYVTGGKGSNQAYAASMQGADAYLVGRIGTDDNGRALMKQLEKAGVDTSFVVRDEGHLTGLSTMNIDADGNYFSIFASGANDHIKPEDVERAMDQVDFDMVVMQLEMPLETVYQTYGMARQRGIPVFLDAGPAMSIPLERLKGIFIISPNEAETAALTGIVPDTKAHTEKAARWLYEKAAPRYVLLKLGSRGALLYDGREMKWVKGYHVDAVDTTAAGDTFGAALAVQYCKGADMETAIRYGHAAAAICVMRKGGHPSIPTAKEVERFLLENKVGRREQNK